METRHLRAIVALAEERHFGRAAARLHLTQPALSQQLKALEREVGTRLLDRSTRRVELTDAGRLLRDRARSVLAELDRTAEDLALIEHGLSGRVRLGFVGTATYDVLPRVAQRVRDDLPYIALELHGERLAPELIDRIHAGDLDLAVLRPGGPIPSGVVVEPLRDELVVAALPSGHRLAREAAVHLPDAAGESVITHPGGHRSTMQPLVLAVCRAAGFEPDVIEVGETSTLVALVAAGLGIGLVPTSVQALQVDGVVYRPLDGPPLTVPLALARPEEPGPAVRRVAEVIRAATGQPDTYPTMP